MFGQAPRYIVFALGRRVGGILAALLAVLWLGLGLRFVDKVIGQGAGLARFLELSALAAVPALPYLLPIAVLVGVCGIYYRMGANSELLAIKAAGGGPRVLLTPLLVVGLLAGLLALGINLWLGPPAAARFRDLQLAIRANLGIEAVEARSSLALGRGRTVYVHERLSDGRLRGVVLQEESAGRSVTLIADEARMVGDGAERQILLVAGQRQERDRATGRIRILSFDRLPISLDREIGEARAKPQLEALSLAELIARPAHRGRAEGRERAEIHRRLALPLQAPAMAILAGGLLAAARPDRRSALRATALAATLGAAGFLAAIVAVQFGGGQPALLLAAYFLPLVAIMAGTVLIVARRPARPAIAAPLHGQTPR